MSDWWTTSTTSHVPFHTPSRPSHHLASSSALTRPRFAGDELDPEDAKMAEGIKFLPSFACSPAGKLALGHGQSPVGGMGSGMAMSTSPAQRRSPTARFTPGAGESPRNARRTGATQTFALEEDLPPTTSLREVDSPTPVRTVSSPPSLPLPPSLQPQPDTTTLHVFGPPPERLAALEPYLSQVGPVNSYRPGPQGSNWWVVEYDTPTAASYALRRHGEILNGRWMLGFKVATTGSTSGCTLVDGGDGVVARGAGKPIRVQSAPIIRQRQVVVQNKAEDYAWEDGEKPVGWGNWVAEKLFGS